MFLQNRLFLCEAGGVESHVPHEFESVARTKIMGLRRGRFFEDRHEVRNIPTQAFGGGVCEGGVGDIGSEQETAGETEAQMAIADRDRD